MSQQSGSLLAQFQQTIQQALNLPFCLGGGGEEEGGGGGGAFCFYNKGVKSFLFGL